MRLGLVLLALFLALFLALPARADDSEAHRHYDLGHAAYNLQRYSEALEHFQAAYELKPVPQFLFDIAQCQRHLGQRAAALASYRAYLREFPNAPNRDQAKQFEEEMSVSETMTTVPSPPELAPPPVAAPAPAANVVAVARAPRRSHGLAAGLGVMGAGLALAITGAALLGVGASDDAAARRASTLPEQRQQWDQGGALQIAGIVTLAASGIGFGVGSILLARRR